MGHAFPQNLLKQFNYVGGFQIKASAMYNVLPTSKTRVVSRKEAPAFVLRSHEPGMYNKHARFICSFYKERICKVLRNC